MAEKTWSENEYTILINRITAIETKLNEIQVALNNLPTKTQMKQLLALRQAEINDLKQRVEALEAAHQ